MRRCVVALLPRRSRSAPAKAPGDRTVRSNALRDTELHSSLNLNGDSRYRGNRGAVRRQRARDRRRSGDLPMLGVRVNSVPIDVPTKARRLRCRRRRCGHGGLASGRSARACRTTRAGPGRSNPAEWTALAASHSVIARARGDWHALPVHSAASPARHQPRQGCALPLSYTGKLAGRAGPPVG